MTMDTEETERPDHRGDSRAGPGRCTPESPMGARCTCRGDIHPPGSASALIAAAAQHVPYVAISAVGCFSPADWLRSECLHDMDRLRIIGNAEAIVRRAC